MKIEISLGRKQKTFVLLLYGYQFAYVCMCCVVVCVSLCSLMFCESRRGEKTWMKRTCK